MNLGQSFLIPLPRLPSEAATMCASVTVMIKRDVTIYLVLCSLRSLSFISFSLFCGKISFTSSFFSVFLAVLTLFFHPSCSLHQWLLRRARTEMHSVRDNWSTLQFCPDGLATNCLNRTGFHSHQQLPSFSHPAETSTGSVLDGVLSRNKDRIKH